MASEIGIVLRRGLNYEFLRVLRNLDFCKFMYRDNLIGIGAYN
jgi:hypothetical protein